ncbi:MAG: phage portal protein [Alphaproteobacteria bacterium]
MSSLFRVLESYAGAWQQNVELDVGSVMQADPVYACITLIARDIAKLPLRLVRREGAIWLPAESPAFGPVLRKPNHFQTRLQFISSWVVSKLGPAGNAYILKARDDRDVVTSLYVLDPTLVTPLVADNGEVFYQLGGDRLAGLGTTGTIVPASEIIHDRCVPLHHPLVGVSPLYAAKLPATLGLAIANNSANFFGGGARPGGVLSAPGTIGDELADRIRATWKQKFSGKNAGQIAVLGEGMSFTPLTTTAADALTPEQAKDAAIRVCGAFHVPAWKINAAPMPAYGNVRDAQVEYYSTCLQEHIEAIEALLDDGLGLQANGNAFGAEFDVEALMRMDTLTKTEASAKAVGAGIKKPNEARADFGLPAVDGGDTPYLQQQNFSLAALARRDARDDPFGSRSAAPVPLPAPPAAPEPAPAPAKAAEPHPLEDGLSPSARSYLKHLVEVRLAAETA